MDSSKDRGPVKIIGECSLCGACCKARIGEAEYRCENLKENRCTVYGERFDMMPIRLVSEEGLSFGAQCGKDSARETAGILLAIEREECSLKVA